MNETLFSQIQRLFERTYAQVGINLEDCLIDRRRCAQLSRLAGASARELSELARTFLRRADDQLYVGIYYSRWLIEQLERHDPRAGLSDRNIRSLIMFVEEINHALHAALQIQERRARDRSEDFARDLELQARVDTYLVLLLVRRFLSQNPTCFADRSALAAFPSCSSRKIPARFSERICAAVISKRPSWPRATPNFSIPSMACGELEEIRTFRSLEYGARKRGFSP